MVVVCLFLVNNFSFALSPTSRFKPAVTLEKKDDGYSIIEDEEEKNKFKDSFQEDTAFVYLNLSIGQFLHEFSELSQNGMSEGGLQNELEEFKASIARDLPDVDFDRFKYQEMYLDGGTVCLPYERKDDGRTQILRYYLAEGETQFPHQVSIPLGDGTNVVLEDPLKDEEAEEPGEGLPTERYNFDWPGLGPIEVLRLNSSNYPQYLEKILELILKLCDETCWGCLFGHLSITCSIAPIDSIGLGIKHQKLD